MRGMAGRPYSRSERAQIAIVLRNNGHQCTIVDVDDLLLPNPAGRLARLVQKIVVTYRAFPERRDRMVQVYCTPNSKRAYCDMIDYPPDIADADLAMPLVWRSPTAFREVEDAALLHA